MQTTPSSGTRGHLKSVVDKVTDIIVNILVFFDETTTIDNYLIDY